MSFKKLTILLIVCLIILLVINYDINEIIKITTDILENIKLLYENNKTLSITLFILIYVVSTSISLPIAALLTIFAGSIFGLWIGVLLVSISSVLGAIIAMLISRFLISDFVEKRFGERIKAIHKNIEEFGIQYLLILRIAPIFPFFLINLAMGLTKMKIIPYTLASTVGMLPGTFLYVYAGYVGTDVEVFSNEFYKIIIALIAIVLFSIITKVIYKRYFCANGRT